MKTSALLLLLGLVAFKSHGQVSPVFAPGGKAINGYDPVAFFNESKPVKGQDSLTFSWQGTFWMFSTKENKALFQSTPDKFAPQFGGYCAFGASQGHKAPTEVDTWSITNGKLYFNYNRNVQKLWNKDRQALIEKADELWPGIKDKE